MNPLPGRLVLFLLLGQLFLFLGSELLRPLLLDLLHRLRLVDNGLDVLVETMEALNFHQGVHGGLVSHQAGKGLVVHIYQQGALPPSSPGCSRGC